MKFVYVLQEHQRELLDEFKTVLQYCLAIREAANLLEKPFSATDYKDKAKSVFVSGQLS